MLNVWTVCWDVVSHDNTWTLAVVSCGVFSLLADDHCLVTSIKYCVAFRHVNYLVCRQSVLSCHDIRFNQGRRRIPRSCGLLKGHWCLVCTCHAAVMSCCQSVFHTTCSSFFSLLRVQFLCLFECWSVIILAERQRFGCCAVVTDGCDYQETFSKEQVCCCWVFRTWDRPHFGGGCVRNIGILYSAREQELIFELRSYRNTDSGGFNYHYLSFIYHYFPYFTLIYCF